MLLETPHKPIEILLEDSPTDSKAEADMIKAYALHANCYITKPIDFGGFAEFVRPVEHFWFSVVTLPPE